VPDAPHPTGDFVLEDREQDAGGSLQIELPESLF
jgi:hypothetical protein